MSKVVKALSIGSLVVAASLGVTACGSKSSSTDDSKMTTSTTADKMMSTSTTKAPDAMMSTTTVPSTMAK